MPSPKKVEQSTTLDALLVRAVALRALRTAPPHAMSGVEFVRQSSAPGGAKDGPRSEPFFDHGACESVSGRYAVSYTHLTLPTKA